MDISKLRWFKIEACLTAQRITSAMKEHSFVVFQSIVKTVNNSSPDFSGMTVIFHIRDKRASFKSKKGAKLNLDFQFFHANYEKVEAWRQAFFNYFNSPPLQIKAQFFEQNILESCRNNNEDIGVLIENYKNLDNKYYSRKKELPLKTGQKISGIFQKIAYYPRNYSLNSITEVKEESYRQIKESFTTIKSQGEIYLDFLSYLPFEKEEQKAREYISKSYFIKLFRNRVKTLFGINLPYRENSDNFEVLPYYWNYHENEHLSKSQPSGTQLLNGCTGKIYLKGDFQNFLPFLILCSQVHIGSQYTHSSGYYKLHFDSKSHILPLLYNANLLLKIIKKVHHEHDNNSRYFVSEDSLLFSEKGFNENAYAQELLGQLKSGRYLPSPHQAFYIKKKNGQKRLVEILTFKELVVQTALNSILYKIFDCSFSKSSIGYRKGISTQVVVSRVAKAKLEGFRFVLKTDIESFFPSISHGKVEMILDQILPEKDQPVKELLIASIKNSYVVNDTLNLRTVGLAQGSPLSPLLTNLYLAQFDQKLSSPSLRLIRFADDLLILTRTEDEAQIALDKVKSLLAEIDLVINPEKTSICSIEDNFEFLGIHFNDQIEKIGDDFERKLYKKAFYVTRPYLFLSVYGDSIQVKKNNRIIATFPFRRISELIILDTVSFSTKLIKKCSDFKIPITTVLNTGYYVTTIKPDTKDFFDTSVTHTNKVRDLSEAEKIFIAKNLIQQKLENYKTLFARKYQKRHANLITQIDSYIDKAVNALSINELRGYEGACAKLIFSGLNSLIDNRCFHIKTRDRKKTDPINSLLNFSYYLLFARLNTLVRANGLNPYAGILHSENSDYESFVCDLEELFRARIDRFIIRTINLRIITEKDFYHTGDRLYLIREKIGNFLQAFEKTMEFKGRKEKLSLKELMEIQIKIIKEWVQGKGSLSFYRWDYQS